MSVAYIAGITPENSAQRLSLYRGLLPRPMSMREIAEEVARDHGVTLEALTGAARNRAIVPARHAAIWRAYETGRFSNQQIGNFFGGRDHTSVIYARKAHAEKLSGMAAAA